MHQRPDHDSSEVKDYHCECRHNGPPPPPKDDMPLPEAADSKDMDDGMTMPDDYENMSVEKKMELMEEHRKHKENERCCRRHWTNLTGPFKCGTITTLDVRLIITCHLVDQNKCTAFRHCGVQRITL
ncbi:hypothetical protein DPMN_113573 [Dreissena polymorpha]|uniref:Uncharacterized protein n=1 Tax=Dreissena polymorpha TaxID=45954 RepID=A0A9D4KII7_DREPO|nr:hypothetical protein DPMN_113573 [Dreissena polymorpha]